MSSGRERRNARTLRLGGYASVTSTDVVYLKLQNVGFRVSAAVLGLFPDSVLMTLFPSGWLPFYSVATGRQSLTTLMGVREGAAKSAQAAVARILQSRRSNAPIEEEEEQFFDASGSLNEESDEQERASVNGGPSLGKTSGMGWSKRFGAEAQASNVGEEYPSSDSSSESAVSEYNDMEVPFHAADDSVRMDLSGIEDSKIQIINFDPNFFAFLLETFKSHYNSNIEAMLRAQEDIARQQQENPPSPVSVEDATDTNETSPSPAAPSPSKKRPSLTGNLFRKMNNFKLSIVTFFAGQESPPSNMGPQPTPSGTVTPYPLGHQGRALILLKEELDYFAIAKAHDPNADEVSRSNGRWQTLKARFRRSFSRASGKVAQSSTASLPKSREGLELGDMRTKSDSDASMEPTPTNLKKSCGDILARERIMTKEFAQSAMDIFETSEHEKAMVETGLPPVKRDRVVFEMEEQIMKKQMMASLSLFCADFKEGAEWHYRGRENTKCRVTSMSLLKIRDFPEIQKAMESEAAAAAAAAEEAEQSKTASCQHLNEHMFSKRAVRKTWWETVKVEAAIGCYMQVWMRKTWIVEFMG